MQHVPSAPSSPPQKPILLPLLRAGTLDLHEQVEDNMDIAVRLSTMAGYKNLLSRFYCFYINLEGLLGAAANSQIWTDLGLDFDSMRKAALLESDLRFLGMTTTSLNSLLNTRLKSPPSSVTPGELIGRAYVTEGATLGGVVIGHHVETVLGIRPGDSGGRFFFGYGARTGINWQRFRAAVEEFAVGNATASGAAFTHQAIDAARRTFVEFNVCLAHGPHDSRTQVNL
jgi:heme oxygenase (biliverdin-IX-beta and delta-forming)